MSHAPRVAGIASFSRLLRRNHPLQVLYHCPNNLSPGLTVLPCYLADGDPEVIQLTDPIPALEYGLWFLMHPDLRGVVRIHALMDFLTESVRAQKERLAGRPLEVD